MEIGLKIRMGIVWDFKFAVELGIKLRVLGPMVRGS
jgi:hypothetical protein